MTKKQALDIVLELALVQHATDVADNDTAETMGFTPELNTDLQAQAIAKVQKLFKTLK